MLAHPNNQIVISESFGSFEQLATIVRAWDLDFRQISSSKHDHQLLQVVMDGVLMSRGRFGCQLDQRGQTPSGLRTFALLEEDSPPMHWFGRRVGPSDLLVFPAHCEIEVISRPGFSNHSFSIAIDDLAEFFELSGGPNLSSILGKEDTVVPLAPVHLYRLRKHLRLISYSHSTMQRSLVLYDAYRDKLFNLLLDILRNKTVPRHALDHQARSQVIRDVVALAAKREDGSPSLDDLCIAGKVPKRTLNEIFRRELGISPGAFVKGYRLFGVHRELWNSNPEFVVVSDVANAFGFWHMGQFAADYRKLFGELPSETLNRLN